MMKYYAIKAKTKSGETIEQYAYNVPHYYLKSSPIYDDVKKILEEISQGLGEGSSVELDAISGADVVVKLNGPVATGMMKDMTLGFIKQKLTDGTGRQISVATR